MGCRDQSSGIRVQGSGFRVQGSEVRGQGSGCRVQREDLKHVPEFALVDRLEHDEDVLARVELGVPSAWHALRRACLLQLFNRALLFNSCVRAELNQEQVQLFKRALGSTPRGERYEDPTEKDRNWGFFRSACPPTCAPAPTVQGKRIFIELMTSHREFKASREGSTGLLVHLHGERERRGSGKERP